jgi:hypothetical protein
MFSLSLVWCLFGFGGSTAAHAASACDENKIAGNDVKVLQSENPVPPVVASKTEAPAAVAHEKKQKKGSKATKAD